MREAWQQAFTRHLSLSPGVTIVARSRQAQRATATDLEYRVLGGPPTTVSLRPGEMWTFGRSPTCSTSLTIPALSRVSLVLQQVGPALLRVTSRQSNRGRVIVASDEDGEMHVLGAGARPVHLGGGNYLVKVELPPVVLRVAVAVPHLDHATVRLRRGVGTVSEQTTSSYDPRDRGSGGPPWLTVAALAVILARYPELGGSAAEGRVVAPRPSEALRRAVAAWTGHTSLYWVNERLKEAVLAADLPVGAGKDRVAAVVSHYAPFFSDAQLRSMRDELVRRGQGLGG